MIEKNENKYFIAMGIAIVCYWLILTFFPQLTSYVTAGTAMVSAIMVWLQLKRNERLNEANYIKDLNKEFISNKDMTYIEHALEMYSEQIYDGIENPKIKLDLRRNSDDCQKLINYLVYMEGLATIVSQDILHVGIIHNIFAYRFFLAVNNPLVQMFELHPYSSYYQGCYYLAKKWNKITSEIKNKNEKSSNDYYNMNIPLKEFMLKSINLQSVDMQNEKRIETNSNIFFNCRKAKVYDCDKVAEILYDTDNYIYPTAFGENKVEAIRVFSKVLKESDGLLNYNNVFLAEISSANECVIVGAILFCDNNTKWDTESTFNIIKDSVIDKNKFMHVANNYFKNCIFEEKNRVEVVALCIDKKYKNNKFGRYLLEQFIGKNLDKRITLTVIKDNPAIEHTYIRCGFKKETEEEYLGYNYNKEDLPKCYKMYREASIDDSILMPECKK